MPRPPRIHIPESFYHVMLRGNQGAELFAGGNEARTFERYLNDCCAKFDTTVHAYCWMPNHIHLLVRTGNDPLGKFMQMLGTRFARYVNRQRGEHGHVFQGRYQAKPVMDDAYAMELLRYIHLNPVRAGLTPDAALYRWSSHRAYTGGPEAPFLETDTLLSLFGKPKVAARQALQTFVEDGLRMGEPADPSTMAGIGLTELAASIAREGGVSLEELCGPTRDRRVSELRQVFALIARRRGIANVTTCARFLARSPSTLVRTLAAFEARLAANSALQDKYAALLSRPSVQ